MKRKKELYDEIKKLEHKLKSIHSIVEDEGYIPSEDEIHGWVISMNSYIAELQNIKKEVVDFYTNC
jgi:hypothetical protein